MIDFTAKMSGFLSSYRKPWLLKRKPQEKPGQRSGVKVQIISCLSFANGSHLTKLIKCLRIVFITYPSNIIINKKMLIEVNSCFS